MLIQFFGQSFFKITVKNQLGQEVVVAIDPFHKEFCGLKSPNKFGADALLITHDHEDHNNVDLVKGAEDGKETFLINGPGEYEVKGVMVYGIPAFHDNANGAERGENTMYLIQAEEMWLAHLGDLGQKSLTDEQLGHLEDIDILLLPVGGGGATLDAKAAGEIVSQIEPRVIIPMHYALPGLKFKFDGVEKFVKEMGLKPETVEEKIRLQKKDLPEEETRLIVIQP
ncbi:MAG: MBL fold metallo-hydrolase [Patescibacteria group bacterium]|nr:MBL fold metallo-hydrolase [Patescibacteria group bacterium]